MGNLKKYWFGTEPWDYDQYSNWKPFKHPRVSGWRKRVNAYFTEDNHLRNYHNRAAASEKRLHAIIDIFGKHR